MLVLYIFLYHDEIRLRIEKNVIEIFSGNGKWGAMSHAI